MCKWCHEAWSEETKTKVAEDFFCEFSTEDRPKMCRKPATYQFTERYVDGHLCEEHAQELTQALGAGLMEVLQRAGVSEGETLKPITTQTACDWARPRGDLCGKPAKYADVTMATTYFCGRHQGWAA